MQWWLSAQPMQIHKQHLQEDKHKPEVRLTESQTTTQQRAALSAGSMYSDYKALPVSTVSHSSTASPAHCLPPSPSWAPTEAAPLQPTDRSANSLPPLFQPLETFW